MYFHGKMKWVICQCCEGNGKVEHPAFSNGITSEEWSDMDYNERESYMRGDYDVTCTECKGSGKVQVPNVELLTFGEKRLLVKHRHEERERAEDLREMRAEMEAERRMGC